MVVEVTAGHLVGGLHDGPGDLDVEQPEVGVRERRGLLEQAEAADDRPPPHERVAPDVEVLEAALGLRAPVAVGGHLDGAHRVAFGAGRRHHPTVCRSAPRRDVRAGEETTDPTPGIRAFVTAALERYPELDEDSGAECPWASAPLIGEAMGDYIYFPMTFSGAGYARDVVAGIAHAHGLVCFDPQIERLLPAADALPASVIEEQVMAAMQQHLESEEAKERGGWWSRLFGRR